MSLYTQCSRSKLSQIGTICLKMNAKKCCYKIFSGAGSKNRDKFELNLTDGVIPYNTNPVFLGVTFDEFLNFGKHTDNLLKRARKRLNIIKIYSHKSWHLSHVTLKGIYNAIIGSIFTYSFFAVNQYRQTSESPESSDTVYLQIRMDQSH